MGREHASASLINEAYETLNNPDRRSEYDRKLRLIPIESYAPVNKVKSRHPNTTILRNNQRTYNRIRKNGELRYSFSWFTPERKAELIDLSSKGVCFLCSEALPQESRVRIKSPVMKGLVKVANSQKTLLNDKVYYSVGAEFLKVTFASSKGTFISTAV